MAVARDAAAERTLRDALNGGDAGCGMVGRRA